MKCPSCGNENVTGTKFCSICGAKLFESAAQQPAQFVQPDQPNNNYQQQPYQMPQYSQQPPQKDPFYKKTWFVILMLILIWPVGLVLMWVNKKDWKLPIKIIITAFFALICIINFASKSGNNNSSDESSSSSSVVVTEVATEASTEEVTKKVTEEKVESQPEVATEAPTEAPETPAPTEDQNVTTGMKNALKSAQNYLDFTAFSYTGLIKQLEYEKYSTEEATYAADNCGADWNEQAAKCAKNYVNFTSFSREGLIDQLIYEGFTQEQAEYGAQAAGY